MTAFSKTFLLSLVLAGAALAQDVAITPAPQISALDCNPTGLQTCGPAYRITIKDIQTGSAALRYFITATLADGNTFSVTGLLPVVAGPRGSSAFATFQLPESAASFAWRIEYLNAGAIFVGRQ